VDIISPRWVLKKSCIISADFHNNVIYNLTLQSERFASSAHLEIATELWSIDLFRFHFCRVFGMKDKNRNGQAFSPKPCFAQPRLISYVYAVRSPPRTLKWQWKNVGMKDSPIVLNCFLVSRTKHQSIPDHYCSNINSIPNSSESLESCPPPLFLLPSKAWHW